MAEAKDTSQLQLYVDTQLEEINPYKVKSKELLADANKLEIKDDKTVREASAIRKQITAHKNFVSEARKDITRQFDDVKDQFMAAEKRILDDAEKAQKVIQKKMLDYDEEQTKIREAEEKRVAGVIDSLSILTMKDLRKAEEAAVEGELAHLDKTFEALPKDDQANATIKLSYANRRSDLLELLDEIMLGAGSDEAEIATTRADAEDAEFELKLKKKSTKAAPKMGVKTKTKFEVENSLAVPKVLNGVELCVPSDKAIRAFIKDNPGVTIPGVRIWEEKGF